MLREQILDEWKICQEKITQLKTKSIDNYAIMNKRTILGLDSRSSYSPLNVCDLNVISGVVNKRKLINKRSNNVVEIQTELLKVAIIEVLVDSDWITNYEGEIDYDAEPTLEVVD